MSEHSKAAEIPTAEAIKAEGKFANYAMAIHHQGKLVLGIKPSGAVDIGDGFTADEAARRFWGWMETIRKDGTKVMQGDFGGG